MARLEFAPAEYKQRLSSCHATTTAVTAFKFKREIWCFYTYGPALDISERNIAKNIYLRRPPQHTKRARPTPTPGRVGIVEQGGARAGNSTARGGTSARVISKTNSKSGLNRSLEPLSCQGQHIYTCVD